MTDSTDRELLRLFVVEGREEAFSQIVNRYANLVYASAMRQLRDSAAAEDAAQAVFIVLWKKACTLRNGAALPNWLLSATRLACLDSVKRKTTRDRHEKEAVVMRSNDSSLNSEALAAQLDAALADLSEVDRLAVVRRYLAGQKFQEVAGALGVSIDAAKKRVARALRRLRRQLAGRGLSSPADVLESGLCAIGAVRARPTLLPAIHAACRSNASPAVAAGAKSVQTALAIAGTKSAVAIAAVTLLAATAVGVAAFCLGGWMNAKPIVQQTGTLYPPPQTARKPNRNSPGTVYIGGNVTRPGIYSIRSGSPMNLLQAVFAASPTDNIDLDTAQLILARKVDATHSIAARFSCLDLLDCRVPPPPLQPDDVVEVELTNHFPPGTYGALPPSDFSYDRGDFVFVGGKVRNGGVYAIDRLDLLEMIFAAVPAHDVAPDAAEAILIRQIDPQRSIRVHYALQDLLDCNIRPPLLQGGDIVLLNAHAMHNSADSAPAALLPANIAPDAVRQAIYIGGVVKRPGAYANSMNLLQSAFATGLDDDVSFDSAELILMRCTDSQKRIRVAYSVKDLMECKIDPPLLQGGDIVLVNRQTLHNPADVAPSALPPIESPLGKMPDPHYIGGAVKQPGIWFMPSAPITDAAQFIRLAVLPDNIDWAKGSVILIRRTGLESDSRTTYPLKDLLSGKVRVPLQAEDILYVAAPALPSPATRRSSATTLP